MGNPTISHGITEVFYLPIMSDNLLERHLATYDGFVKVHLPFDKLMALSKAEGPFDRFMALSKAEGLRYTSSFVIAT